MDALLGIIANTPPISIGANGSVIPASGLLASGLSLLTPGLSGSASAVVELSGTGQLLSAAATFQDQLGALQSGTAASGGQTYGTDVASLAAEAQRFVDTFNNLQNNIANINGTNNLLGKNIPGAAGLVQALNTQAQASFSNGNSALTNLSQLGIAFQPATIPGGGGSLSVNLGTLESAFNTDATGAFSLLSTAANTFSNLASNFVGPAGSQSPIIGALEDAFLADQLPTDILLPQVQASGGNLVDLLALASLSPSNLGNVSTQQVILAMNEYALVSSLLG